MTKQPDTGIQVFRSWVDDYLDNTHDHRERAALRRDYVTGIQWTEEEHTKMDARGQPVLTFNYLGEKVSTMIGAEVQGRTDPIAIGRNSGVDQATAAVATASMRYVTDEADWDGERTMAREQLFTEGVCAVEIPVDSDTAMANLTAIDGTVAQKENPEISLRSVPYDRLFWDPHSSFDDFRDAKYFGTMIWQDLDEAIADWPGKDDVLTSSVSVAQLSGDGASETFSDRPHAWVSGQGNRKRLRIANMWFRNGRDWQYVVFCAGGALDGPRKSPYVDDRNRTIPGMVLRSAITRRRSNERIGPVEDLISPQDEVNKRRSKALHLMNTKQIMAHEGAFRDIEETRRQLHRADGIILYNPSRQAQVLDHQAQVIENLQLLQEAKAAFETLGPQEGLVGQAGAGASGVAIERRQSTALMKFGRVIDGGRRFELQVYRHIWYRIRQYWTEHDYIRVTEDEQSEQYLEVNRQVTVADILTRRGVPPEQLAALHQSGHIEASGIDLSEVVAIENNLQQLDVDIIIDARPESPTYRHDQIAAVADLFGKLPLPPEAAPTIAEIVLEMVDVDPRIKKRVMKRLQPSPEQQQAQAQQAAEAQALTAQTTQLAIAKAQAEVEKIVAETDRLKAQAETEESAAIENIANANRSMSQANKTNEETTQPTQLIDVASTAE